VFLFSRRWREKIWKTQKKANQGEYKLLIKESVWCSISSYLNKM